MKIFTEDVSLGNKGIPLKFESYPHLDPDPGIFERFFNIA